MRRLNPEYVEIISKVTSACPYFQLLSMKVIDLDIGSCRLEVELAEKHLQPFGLVHGGVFASVIDAATFWAVFPEVDDNVGMTSVDLKLNYLGPAAKGRLIARGRRIKLGRTLGLGEAEVTDEEGKLLAQGTSTLMVMPGIPFNPKVGLPPKFIE